MSNSYLLQRPSSEQLVDLHVYLFPREAWNEKYRSSFNESISEAQSAGFVRVWPELTVNGLRMVIDEELGHDILPHNYVFLRSVGRCMTQVKHKQELELKCKAFLPPAAWSPEIFVLEMPRDGLGSSGTYQSFDATQSVNGMNHDRMVPPEGPSHMMQQSIQEDPYGPVGGGIHGKSGRPDAYTNDTNEDSGISEPTPEEYDPDLDRQNPGVDSQYYNQLPPNHPQQRQVRDHLTQPAKLENSQYQDAVRGEERQREAEVQRREEQRRHEIEEERRREQEKIEERRTTERRHRERAIEERRKEDEKKQRIEEEKKAEERSRQLALRKKEEEDRKRAEEERKRAEEKQRAEDKRRAEERRQKQKEIDRELEEARQQKIKEMKEQQRMTEEAERRLEEERQDKINERIRAEKEREQDIAAGVNEETMDYDEDHRGTGHMEMGPLESSDGQFPTDAQLTRRAEQELRGYEPQSTWSQEQGGSSGGPTPGGNTPSKQGQRMPSDRDTEMKTQDAVQEAVQDGLKRVHLTPEVHRKAKIGKVRKESTADEEDMYEVDPKMADLIEQLRAARQERQEKEKERENMIKKAKALQAKTHDRRYKAFEETRPRSHSVTPNKETHPRDYWKKRYFDEKKKTVPMEEEVTKLRHQMDVMHRKLMSHLEGKKGKNVSIKGPPSKKNDHKITILKLQHEVDEIKRQVDNARMKLTSEIKLRNQAEQEVRNLKADVTQRKINLTLTRNQKLAALKLGDSKLLSKTPVPGPGMT